MSRRIRLSRRRGWGAASALAMVLACGAEPPPVDCGDASMSIVTFQGQTQSDEGEIRTCIDIHAASRPDATATSLGLDGSFATSRPNVLPWTNLTFGQAVEACSRAGKFLCTSDELRAIAPSSAGLTQVVFDETEIVALSPTSDVTSVPHQFGRLNRYDLLRTPERLVYPESSGSVAYFTASPKFDDKSVDPTIPLLLGRVAGDAVAGGVLKTAPVLDPEYKHPLVGFRCCINAKMRSAFEPLPRDPRKVRAQEDGEVPIAPAP